MKKSANLGTNLFLPLLVAGALFAGVDARAQIISLNLTEFATDAQQIDADETYGVASLGTLTGGWVNLNQSLTRSDLAFSDGSASTVDVVLTAPNSWGSGGAAYNDTPMRGFIDDYTGTANPTSLTLSELKASFPLGYFAVVYLSGFNLNDGASITDGTTTFYYQPVNLAVDTWDGTLVQATTTSDLGSGNAPVAQYAVFGSPSSPLVADSVTFTLDTLYGGGSGLGGVQIVGVPEPSVAVTLGIGVGCLALVRRVRRT